MMAHRMRAWWILLACGCSGPALDTASRLCPGYGPDGGTVTCSDACADLFPDGWVAQDCDAGPCYSALVVAQRQWVMTCGNGVLCQEIANGGFVPFVWDGGDLPFAPVACPGTKF